MNLPKHIHYNFVPDANRELKQQRRRIFLELIFKDCIKVQKKKKKKERKSLSSFTSSTKREIRHFHVVVVQRRQGNVEKSVIYMQSCCFAK